MMFREIREGDRFEEINPTGDAGALWQVVSTHPADEAHPKRAHLFNVDNPSDIRTVNQARLLDGSHYRYTETASGGDAAA